MIVHLFSIGRIIDWQIVSALECFVTRPDSENVKYLCQSSYWDSLSVVSADGPYLQIVEQPKQVRLTRLLPAWLQAVREASLHV